MIEYLLKNYEGEIHISLGMTTKKEEKEIINLIRQYKRRKSIILYHCISAYPIDAELLYLREIERLIKYKSFESLSISISRGTSR